MDSFINGLNYCCHTVCYRTVQSLYVAALAWWLAKLPHKLKGHMDLSPQQLICAPLQRQTFKSYVPQGARCLMLVHPSQRNMQRKTTLINVLDCIACGDLLLVKRLPCAKMETSSVLHTLVSLGWSLIAPGTVFCSSPLLVQSEPHCEAAGYISSFYMDQCQLTGKIGCNLLGIGSI